MHPTAANSLIAFSLLFCLRKVLRSVAGVFNGATFDLLSAEILTQPQFIRRTLYKLTLKDKLGVFVCVCEREREREIQRERGESKLSLTYVLIILSSV